MVVVRVITFVLGALLVAATIGSAVRTVVLPRGIPARIGRVVFIGMRVVFRVRTGRGASYERRDRVMSGYAPASLLALLLTWVLLVVSGFTAMFWGLEGGSLREAFVLSGSSIFTLGFERPPDLLGAMLAFSGAALGLTLVALLITYLPSIYQAFSRREQAVALL